MSIKEESAKNAAIANANLNIWGVVVALMESGLSGPSVRYYAASAKVIKIAQAQMQKDLARYDKALAQVRAAS